MSCHCPVKRSGNPASRGSRRTTPCACSAAGRKRSMTSAGFGSDALRIIWTMARCPAGQMLDRVHERQTEDVHGQIDGAAATLPRAGVVPLGSGGQNLELSARGAHVPAFTVIGLERHITRVGL